jgi:hypothetical protein
MLDEERRLWGRDGRVTKKHKETLGSDGYGEHTWML